MSLLTICQGVARLVPVAIPTVVIGNGDTNASLLLACAQKAGEALARRPQGGWVATIKEYDFATAAVTTTGTVTSGSAIVTAIPSTASLAAGVFYATGNGILDNTTILTVDSLTQVTLNQAATASATATQITFGKSDYSLPADFQRLIDSTLWDRSRFWSMRGPLSPQQWQLYKSSVIGRASIQRRFRFRQILGTQRFSVDPVPGDNGAALVFEYVSKNWCQSSLAVAQNAWAADTDTGILDEYLIELGTMWRFLNRLGMAYEAERDEYDREVDKALAHDGGAGILSISPSDALHLIGPYQLPETGFGQ